MWTQSQEVIKPLVCIFLLSFQFGFILTETHLKNVRRKQIECMLSVFPQPKICTSLVSKGLILHGK